MHATQQVVISIQDVEVQSRENIFLSPEASVDVIDYCKSCETCQLASKYKTKLRAPMIPLPVVGQPFEKIAMDIVGPLERSKSGNSYVIVICDYATRYPEAIALKRIEAIKENSYELVRLFSRVGIPREILTGARVKLYLQVVEADLSDVVHQMCHYFPISFTDGWPLGTV